MQRTLPALLLIFILATPFYAAIDLVTVPDRESVQLTIYNSADITMVRDKRTLTFKPGLNQIKFTWANTLIDPSSLRLSLFNKDKLELIDTTYPPNEKTALIWNVNSQLKGPAKVEISYFTSGITWQANYSLIANQSETHANLRGYLDIINNSGEEFEKAEIRVVVGYIHLVEDIKKLAQGYETNYRDLEDDERLKVQRKFNEKIAEAETSKDYDQVKPKQVVKEGLSEYFLFSIDGQETIKNRWQKRLKAIEANRVPIQLIYRLSDLKTNGRINKFYEFKNQHKGKTEAHSLGQTPLPNGSYQVFRTSQNGLRYEAKARQKYIAAGDKVKLNLGVSLDIRLERHLYDYKRKNITLATRYGSNNPYVKNYIESFYYRIEITNTLKKAALIEIERQVKQNFSITGASFKVDKISQQLFRYYPSLKAGRRLEHSYQIDIFQGSK